MANDTRERPGRIVPGPVALRLEESQAEILNRLDERLKRAAGVSLDWTTTVLVRIAIELAGQFMDAEEAQTKE